MRIFLLNITGFLPNMTGFVLELLGFVLNVCGFVLNRTVFLLQKTGFIKKRTKTNLLPLKVTRFLHNKSGFFLNMTRGKPDILKSKLTSYTTWVKTNINITLYVSHYLCHITCDTLHMKHGGR